MNWKFNKIIDFYPLNLFSRFSLCVCLKIGGLVGISLRFSVVNR